MISPQPPRFRMNRRKTVSVTPAIGARTVAGTISSGPIRRLLGKGHIGVFLVDCNRVPRVTKTSWQASEWEGEEPVKPLQIALLVVAGAVGGAIVMRVTERPQQPALPAASAPPPSASTQTSVETQAPEAAASTEPVEKPSPLPERRAASRARATRRTAPRVSEPVAIAQNAPPAAVTAPPIQQATPEPPPPAPAQTEVSPRPEPPAPAPPPPPRQVTLNAGTLIPVRLIDGLTTQRNNTGDTFTASLDQPLVVDGLVIAERGSRVEGRVVTADKGGKVSGVALLAIQLTRIHLSDQTISVQSDNFEKHAEQTRGTDAAKVGGGAAIGAIIGAIAGGGKGAAIGAGAGGGVGAGDVLLTRGKPAVLPSETRITFRLGTPVTITERRS